ncbi:hypothetical protein GCM10009566_22890 [Streptomyces murinus]
MATANIGQNMTPSLDRPAARPAPGRTGGDAGYTAECSRRVRTPPSVSSSTMRSPAGLRTAAPQSGQVKE